MGRVSYLEGTVSNSYFTSKSSIKICGMQAYSFWTPTFGQERKSAKDLSRSLAFICFKLCHLDVTRMTSFSWRAIFLSGQRNSTSCNPVPSFCDSKILILHQLIHLILYDPFEIPHSRKFTHVVHGCPIQPILTGLAVSRKRNLRWAKKAWSAFWKLPLGGFLLLCSTVSHRWFGQQEKSYQYWWSEF